MSAWTTYRFYRRFLRTQRLAPAALRRLQEKRVGELVRHAVATVPYYRRLLERAAIPVGTMRSLTDLTRVPVTTKADLVRHEPSDLISTAYATDAPVVERTSGSCGRPFEVIFDRRFAAVRRALFLRALAATGYRPGRPALLLTADPRRTNRMLRWRYASINDPPDRLVALLEAHRPYLLYGPVTSLRLLAQLVDAERSAAHRPQVIVATAETLDPFTRRLLHDAFGAEVFDFFGLTETGMLGWECRAHAGLHLSEDAVVTELEPTGEADEFRLVVTNLESRAMPLIRYATGDIVRRGSTDRCQCGRRLARITAVAGRSVDCVRSAGGRMLSPYRITLAMEGVPGLRRYQVVQEALHRFTVRYESDDAAARTIETEVPLALRRVLGPEAAVSSRREASLDPPPGRKFKVVECRIED